MHETTNGTEGRGPSRFGRHPGMTRRNGQLCCYVCDCPFVPPPDGSTGPDDVLQANDILYARPVDDRPCIPTRSWRWRQATMPIRMAGVLILILLTQGPRILRNRLGWWILGPDVFSSGCWLCGGTGRTTVLAVDPGPDGQFTGPGRRRETNCGMCNGLHD